MIRVFAEETILAVRLLKLRVRVGEGGGGKEGKSGRCHLDVLLNTYTFQMSEISATIQ